MKHFSEEELVAYQLCESDDASAVRKHLELCPPCAAVSDAIAETLRMFSAEKVHEADLDGNWRRLRSSLRVLEPEPRHRHAPLMLLRELGLRDRQAPLCAVAGPWARPSPMAPLARCRGTLGNAITMASLCALGTARWQHLLMPFSGLALRLRD